MPSKLKRLTSFAFITRARFHNFPIAKLLVLLPGVLGLPIGETADLLDLDRFKETARSIYLRYYGTQDDPPIPGFAYCRLLKDDCHTDLSTKNNRHLFMFLMGAFLEHQKADEIPKLPSITLEPSDRYYRFGAGLIREIADNPIVGEHIIFRDLPLEEIRGRRQKPEIRD